jgi:acetolactate synthase-1/2/3 large subunit
MKIQVSELIVRYMERLGVEYIFGMPGAHILPVYDALYDSKIESVLAKHEQGAAFMAGGYARVSAKIGACIATAGPGATNLVTGIANAYADKQPVLIITGETSTGVFGRGGLQESSGEGGAIDQTSLFRGITKYHRLVERTDYLASVLNQASDALLSDSPGPVLLSFPFNLQKEMVDESLLDSVKTRRRSRTSCGDSPLIDAVTDRLLDAKQPVIVAGYGAILSGARERLSRLSETLSIPVATSLKAKGVIDEHSSLSLGSLGVTSGGYAYDYIANHADLLLFLGAGFNERTSYLWDPALLEGKQIIQIDNNPEQLEKVFRADIAVAADIDDALAAVLDRVEARDIRRECPGHDRLGGEGSTGAAHSIFDAKFALVEHFFKRFETRFPRDIQIFDDNIVFAQNFLDVSRENRYYPNSGISSLGHAIPAAIGGRFADPRPTFAILGDGGFQMCCMELMTAVNYRLPLTVFLFNNATMGLIRKNQSQQYDRRYIDCDFVNPDYAYLARSFGINHRRIASEEDLDAAFSATDFEAGINLIEIMIDRDAFPRYSSRR